VRRWVGGIAEAVAAFVAGPTGMTRIDIDQRQLATADGLLAEWREMSLPAEYDVGGPKRLAAGVDLPALANDVAAAAGAGASSAQDRSDLLRRLDLVIPELRGEGRQYFAMAREVVRRAVSE
jgi:hypothetical protein